jgi:hypothetical protein
MAPFPVEPYPITATRKFLRKPAGQSLQRQGVDDEAFRAIQLLRLNICLAHGFAHTRLPYIEPPIVPGDEGHFFSCRFGDVGVLEHGASPRNDLDFLEIPEIVLGGFRR